MRKLLQVKQPSFRRFEICARVSSSLPGVLNLRQAYRRFLCLPPALEVLSLFALLTYSFDYCGKAGWCFAWLHRFVLAAA
jgi:hypothetical protein